MIRVIQNKEAKIKKGEKMKIGSKNVMKSSLMFYLSLN